MDHAHEKVTGTMEARNKDTEEAIKKKRSECKKNIGGEGNEVKEALHKMRCNGND